jgi:hypothetical protein
MGPGAWVIQVKFFGAIEPDETEDAFPTLELNVDGGVDREFVSFALSILHEDFAAQPSILTATVPREGESSIYQMYVRQLNDSRVSFARLQDNAPVLVIDVAQGTQTVQVVPVRLAMG